MKDFYYILLIIIIINCFTPSLTLIFGNDSLENEEVININQNIQGDTDHKTAEYSFKAEKNKYFKYVFSSLPSSLITTFRIEFDNYGTDISKYKILCINVDTSKDDSYIINTLKNLAYKDSACIDGFARYGFYEGIARLDESNKILAIIMQEEKSDLIFSGRINIRITERNLKTDEFRPGGDELYTLIPYSITINTFREKDVSKILFYSQQHELHMFYAGNSPYPDRLFSGNILNVYTNPNMVRQKYHNAKVMTLIAKPFDSNLNDFKDYIKFEIKLFESNYLLDYYVSSNSEGRPLLKPLLINMTECTNPYYAILNYNQQEGKRNLFIDQIYGKLKSLKVAYSFTQNTWDEMLSKDMNEINIEELKYQLPENSKAHIDVYKIECELPLMFNFYFTDETNQISKMNYGDINLFTLSPHESVNVPLFNDIFDPEIIIEIFNPYESPTVVIKAQEENVYQSNSLIKLVPMTISNGISIKERGGLSNTRIIIKIGYPNSSWIETDDPNVKYNEIFQVYSFKFPMNESKYNYTFAFLKTSGTNDDDNVKYCFTTNIGAALKPSSENCYRVSENNSYTLKVFNPLNMYKNYNYDIQLDYYVTFRIETKIKKFNIESDLKTYDTKSRIFLGESTKIILKDNNGSSILTQPENYNTHTFVQIQICDIVNSITAKIIKPLTNEIIVEEVSIPANFKNKYIKFDNTYLDSEIIFSGNDNTNIFLRLSGLPYNYVPELYENYDIIFDENTNTINIKSPIHGDEIMEYTVIIDREGVIKSKGYTLCDFVNYDLDKLGKYHKTISSEGSGSIQINFKEAGFNVGEKFDAIVYIEQKMFTLMAFLTDVFQGTVGNISIDSIHEINEVYPKDNDYVYTTMKANESDPIYYFTFQPDKLLDVPFGAMRIELSEEATGGLLGVFCAFVNKDTDSFGIIEEIEKMIELGDSYCIGGKSKINSKRYNYIFKYEENKEDKSPKKMIIKTMNNLLNGEFNIYIRKEPGVEIEATNFTEKKKYGLEENNKKSIIPYIVNLEKIRGEESDPNKISKILFYSKYSELQMYYISNDDMDKAPKRLFFGNIALVLTNTSLAIQKYHAKTLILLSVDPQVDIETDSFRFHTKMFRSEDQIEFFVSENSEGRTLNFPLSLEMKECNEKISKLYYILNYNKPEPTRTLHFDMIFGSYKKARIAKEINSETWENLVDNMNDIEYYQTILPEKSQHIDVIEIECASPLLINAYYSYNDYIYDNLQQGEIVVKELLPRQELLVTIEPQEEEIFYYSLSLYNHEENPQFTLRFSGGTDQIFTKNTMQEGQLLYIPSSVTFINNAQTNTRFIFKIGLNVEKGKNWKEDTSFEKNGKLFVSGNKHVYKFPGGSNKRSYTKVDFLVNAITPDIQNVKFCYSTNLGVALEASRENCFRTGRFIPYTLSFLNPLIVSKDYETTNENYYISFKPYYDFEFISLTITENTYESKNRNEEGKANLITLDNKSTSTILSLPKLHTSQILIQIRSCTDSEFPLTYKAFNALSQNLLKVGKTSFKDDIGYGIFYITDNTWVETELKLEVNENEKNTIQAFAKHSAISSKEVIIEENYHVILFDETKNTVMIKKPIKNEVFTISIVIDYKGQLDKYTQCDFSFGDISKIGGYQKTFISVTSNIIIHFIDFEQIEFREGTEFDLLVYAMENSNTKMEFLYPVFKGKVGKLSGVEKVSTYIEKDEYATLNFKYNLNSNYLYFDFPKSPYGLISSLKILSPEIKVSKISCVFVSNQASDSIMISAVNNAMLEDKNVCLNLGSNNKNEFNALIKAKLNDENYRLVMQVIYDPDNENYDLKEQENTINIKIEGTKFGDSTGIHTLDEKLTPIPFVIDLEEIRNKTINDSYVSKILFYSNTTKMTMYYISDNSPTPLKLFEGNIMLVYTSPELILQKYHNAKQMILTTNTLGQKQNIIDVQYFSYADQIQYYYLGSEAKGRVLNNPTAIEMISCDLPYYYILNYNQVETEKRKLYIDNIFGEVDSIKITTSLEFNSWNELLGNMSKIDNDQIFLPETRYPFDIIEVKCKLPLLLNLYYADPNLEKTTGLGIGDIIILSLGGKSEKVLKFKSEQKSPFIYSFTIRKENNMQPNIEIFFDDENRILATKNGLYIKDSKKNFEEITISNLDNPSDINTSIIMKIGYAMETSFTNIGDDIYQNKDVEGRTINLYGYKYITNSQKLNYTGVDFEISTNEDNVKFCYNTNLGGYINPSLTNCFRVDKNNPYTFSTRNPFVMYKNYFQENVNDYYVGFITAELNQNIIINQKLMTYDTNLRNFEDVNSKIKITDETSSIILTAPSNHNKYIFTYICICPKGENLSYEFYNAYNGSNLGYNDTINSVQGYDIKSVPNTKLDTELKLIGKKDLEIFIKYMGLDIEYKPTIENIAFSYNASEKKLEWTQPIKNEEFRYDIYIDKINNIKDKNYTLCSLVDMTKFGRFHDNITTDSNKPFYIINFNVSELNNLTDFDVIIVAQQLNNGKLIFLSPVYNSKEESSDEPSDRSDATDGSDGTDGKDGSDTTDGSRSQETDRSNNSNNNSLVGIIVGSVVGGLVLIGLIVFFVIRYYRKKNASIEGFSGKDDKILSNSVNEEFND